MKKLVLIVTLILLNFASAQIVVQGDITNDLTLTSSNTYLLRGFVRIKSGATLTVQPGTVIYGENSSQGSLIVQPGGRIIADGTKENPIVFTSEFRKPGASRTPTYGDWGGIILLGNARINVPGGTAQIEGPGDIYGGNNDDDNSGILRYVRIEYPGIAFAPNNEINGLTLGGVGRGTTLEYIQVSFSGDDSYEWFGGNVNGKYLIAYKGWDDDFDTDFGFSGKLQFLLSVRDPQIADQSSSNGFESDNDGSGSSNTPLTSPTWYNVTLVGPKQDAATQINSLYKRGMHLRRNSQNKISNALIMGWPTGILLDGTGTINNAANQTNYIKNSIISGATSKNIDTTKSNGTFSPDTWFTTTMSGRVYSNNGDVKLNNPYSSTQPDFLPASDSPVHTGAATPPTDGFFDPTATYVGAFKDVNWTATWADFNPTGPTSVEDEINVNSFELSQNYPNPFNPSTTISYRMATAQNVTLKIFDVLGNEVATLVNEVQNAGNYSVEFDASTLSSGIYMYRLSAGNIIQTKKMSLLK
ncbi:MAG: T9SS type A sorting domain-containing protein [Ignavibacteriaceae bacterium]